MIMINRFSEKNVTDRVMFSQACVKNSVPGGGGVSVPACTTGHMTGVVCWGDPPGQRPPCTVTSGRYASYWNAFFLQLILIEIS